MENSFRQGAKMRCSIIIPVYNHAALTRQCLDAVLACRSERVAQEIVVVDDGSTDGTAELLASYGSALEVVTHRQNAGFARSCNDGAARATGEGLVFLNNDTIPQPGWLTALVDHARSHPEAVAVGSKLLFPDQTIQHAGVVICQDGDPRHLYAGFPADHPAVNKARPFQVVTAACVLIRRRAFEEAGGFDPAFRNGFEDVDLCLRLGKEGHEIHYCPKSVLQHLESVSREGRSRDERHNYRLYRSRWASRVRADDLDYYLADGLLEVRYGASYPVTLSVSPMLALLEGDERARRADRLLRDRAGQVFDLLKEVVRLHVRVKTVEAQLASAAARDRVAASTAAGSSALVIQTRESPALTAVAADGVTARIYENTVHGNLRRV
jgi:GT2 family glycosyltransferase